MQILCMLTYEHCGLAFLILRVYAISGHKWQFTLAVGLLYIFPNGFSIVRVFFYLSLGVRYSATVPMFSFSGSLLSIIPIPRHYRAVKMTSHCLILCITSM